MADPPPLPPLERCSSCGTELAGGLLACPACGRLVHAQELARLAAEAERLEAASDGPGAVAAWRQAQALIPPGAPQWKQVGTRIEAALKLPRPKGVRAPDDPARPKHGWWKAAIIGVGLAAWKLKAVAIFAVTKWKFLFFGLAKGGTIVSMIASFGVMGLAWGWKVGAGLLVSIYIHELGHVVAFVRRGFTVSAPMFVPGFGAYVRSTMAPSSPREGNRIALAGPLWGLGASAAAWGAWYAWGHPVLAGIGKLGAFINLMNLLPIWVLDGNKAFESFTRKQRFILCGAIVAAIVLTHEGFLVILLILAAVRAFAGKGADEPDWPGLAWFVGIMAGLSALNWLPLPPPAP